MDTENVPPLLPSHLSVPPVIKPPVQPPPLPNQTRRPGVIVVYRWWCILFVLIYLSFSIFELSVTRGTVEPSLNLMDHLTSAANSEVRAEIIARKRAAAPGMAVGMAAVALLYVAGAAISRKPQSWTLGLVVICTTIFPFLITLAGVIPLIICWCKPDVKLYFNRRS